MAKNAVVKAWSLPLTDGRYYSDPANIPTPGERFYVTNPVASPTALTRIYPLSTEQITALTSSGSASWYQSKWAAGIPWRLPLGYMGGTYPYDFVLTGPVGAAIDYGGRSGLVPPFMESIYWADPTEGTHEFTLAVVDQNDDTLEEITFTLIVYDEDNTTHCGWVNPGHASASDSNTGSRASPWLTINGWYASSLSASTHRNKVIFYEDVGVNSGNGINLGGVTGVSYSGSGTQRLRLNDNKPKVHVAVSEIEVHGNGAHWNFDGGEGWTFAGPFLHDDATVVEAIVTPAEDGYRHQYFRGGNGAYKYGFIGLGYTAIGTADQHIGEGSNSSFVEFQTTLGGVASTFEGYFLPGVILDGISTTNEGTAGVKNNNAMGVLTVGWEIKNCENIIVFHHKGGDIRRTEDRGHLAIENNSNSQFRNVQWIQDPVQRASNTWCWNNYDMATSPPVAGWGGDCHLQGGTGDNYSNQAGWRNNSRAPFINTQAASGVLTLTRNVRIHSGAHTQGISDTGAGTVVQSNEYVSTTAADLDATTNLLAGAARAAQLGLAGCEMTEA